MEPCSWAIREKLLTLFALCNWTVCVSMKEILVIGVRQSVSQLHKHRPPNSLPYCEAISLFFFNSVFLDIAFASDHLSFSVILFSPLKLEKFTGLFFSFHILKSLSYSGTKLYIHAPIHHSFNKFLIRAYNMLDSVLQKRRMRENWQISGESKREMRKREDTPREAKNGGHFSKGVRNSIDCTQGRNQGKWKERHQKIQGVETLVCANSSFIEDSLKR